MTLNFIIANLIYQQIGIPLDQYPYSPAMAKFLHRYRRKTCRVHNPRWMWRQLVRARKAKNPSRKLHPLGQRKKAST